LAGFLEGYGASDARREKIIKRTAIVVIIAAILGISGYFYFRDWREQRQAQKFFTLLRQEDYQAAYRLWGCDPSRPCRDYSMDSFLEDWGPKSPHKLQDLKLGGKKSCPGGIIQSVQFGADDELNLWVNRGDLTLSFAPWPVCNPRWTPPSQSP
jgi:hypothetical protein